MSEWNECSSSESPCPHNASQQVSASCDLCSGADVVSRFSNWPPWRPSWIMEWKNFSNSKSQCHPNASHQVRAQSDLLFAGRYGLKIFKMAIVMAILDIRKILAILNLCCYNASHQVSAQSDLWFGSRFCLKIFKMTDMAAILDIGTQWF